MGAINSPFPISKASFQAGVPFYYTELLSTGIGVISRPATVAAGLVWKRGTILKYTPSGTAGTPGAATMPAVETDCNSILATDVDTSPTGTNAPGTCEVYVKGQFKVDAITWPASGVHGLIDQNLRMMGLFLESVQQNTGQNAEPYAAEAKDPAVIEAETKAREAHAKAAEADADLAEAVAKAKADAEKKAKEDAAKKAKEDAEKANHASVTHHNAETGPQPHHSKEEPPAKKPTSEHHK